jgi:hypothetical protein
MISILVLSVGVVGCGVGPAATEAAPAPAATSAAAAPETVTSDANATAQPQRNGDVDYCQKNYAKCLSEDDGSATSDCICHNQLCTCTRSCRLEVCSF